MPKRFICLAEDASGKKYSGVFEAAGEEEARKMVAREGFIIISLKEDSDPARNYSKTDKNSWGNLKVDRDEKIYNKLPPGKRKINWSNELLSYAMPLGAVLIALAGIPLVMMFLKPAPPKESPVQVIERYYEMRDARDFENQFALLSDDLRARYESSEDYVRKMRNKMVLEGKDSVNQIALSGESKSLATVTANVFRQTGLSKLEFQLKQGKGEWKINAIRDPAYVSRMMAELDASNDEEQRKIIRDLKLTTGYSDLEIEEFLKEYRAEKKARQKAEKGINDIFDIS